MLILALLACLPDAVLSDGSGRSAVDHQIEASSVALPTSHDPSDTALDTGGDFDTGDSGDSGDDYDTADLDTGDRDTGEDFDTSDTGDSGVVDSGDGCDGIESLDPGSIRVASTMSAVAWTVEFSGCATGVTAAGAEMIVGPDNYTATWLSVPSEIDGTATGSLEFSGGSVSAAGELVLMVEADQGDPLELVITLY